MPLATDPVPTPSRCRRPRDRGCPRGVLGTSEDVEAVGGSGV